MYKRESRSPRAGTLQHKRTMVKYAIGEDLADRKAVVALTVSRVAAGCCVGHFEIPPIPMKGGTVLHETPPPPGCDRLFPQQLKVNPGKAYKINCI